jgi:hypothetical protein
MAYNRNNKAKQESKIFAEWLKKGIDYPDTYFVKTILPKAGVFISYRTWMNIKNRQKAPENANKQGK